MSLIRVVACVIEKNNKVLLCRRPYNKRHGGFWEFPGGKIEEGETHEEAIAREIKEELDCEVCGIGSKLYEIQDANSSFRIEFYIITINGLPKLIEHIEMRWCSLEQLVELPLAPSDESFYKQ